MLLQCLTRVFWDITTTHFYVARLLFPAKNVIPVCAPLGCVCVHMSVSPHLACCSPSLMSVFCGKKRPQSWHLVLTCDSVLWRAEVAWLWCGAGWSIPAVHLQLQHLQFLPQETSLWAGGWGKECRTCLCSEGAWEATGTYTRATQTFHTCSTMKVGRWQSNPFCSLWVRVPTPPPVKRRMSV